MERRHFEYCTCLLIVVILTKVTALSAQVAPGGVARPTAVANTVPGAYTNTTINYIRTWEPSMPSTDPAVITNTSRTVGEVKQSNQYFDGLGRPVQGVDKAMGAGGKDVVSPVLYDLLGREQFKYLPYVQQTGNTSDGKFKADPFAAQAGFYQNSTLAGQATGETIYYSQTDYETSPLGRAQASYAPGNSWSKTGGNKPIKEQYLVNSAADSVRIWKLPAAGVIPSSNAGQVYRAGTLVKNVIIDEANNQAVEYKDMEGRVILKKRQVAVTPTAHIGWACTYYVYDDFGSLRFVIPPKAVDAITGTWSVNSSIAAELCYVYRYDGRNRMTTKKLPGADSVEMVYDTRDRLAFSRDGNLKSGNNWLAYFYDEQNRNIMTALYNAPGVSRASLQSSMNPATSNTQTLAYTFPGVADLVLGTYDFSHLYQATNSVTLQDGFDTGDNAELVIEINGTINSGTTSVATTNSLPGISAASLTPLIYTYYDNYTSVGLPAYDSGDRFGPQAGGNSYAEPLPTTASTKLKGQVTGMKIRVIGTDQWLTSAVYYNDKGRIIQTVTDNISGGKDVLTHLYDFNGKELSTYLKHSNPRSGITPNTTLLKMYHYDNTGKIDSVKMKLNYNDSLLRTLAVNTFDALGTLNKKRIGVTGTASQMETLSYNYNIRGWLKGINTSYVNTAGSVDNWFGQEINYDYGFTTNQFTGNIGGIKWKSKSDGVPRAYGYTYDKINRLTAADFMQISSGTVWDRNTIDFSVSNLAYDGNGNIRSMTQKGMTAPGVSGLIDQLTYTYRDNSNKLTAVSDLLNTLSAGLGDFNDGNKTGADYSYDTTGNLTKDLNKNISSISYNHLGLPQKISFGGKGNIVYFYDAAGNKLRDVVTDSTGPKVAVTNIDYNDDLLYKNDTLRYVTHDEGRIRTVLTAGKPVGYQYDYFLKDHLGNVRMVLTEQSDLSMYAATMENANSAKENILFSNIDLTRSAKPAGYPADATTSPNDNVAKLNAANGQKIGPSIVLRVMVGDTLQIGTKAFYKSTGTSTAAATTPGMLTALLQAFSGEGVQSGVHNATGPGSPIATAFNATAYDQLKQKDPLQNLSGKPKAYLNYVLFDDQFKIVDENSGVKQVQGTVDAIQTLATGRMVMKKTGFVYVYTSNESGQDVYFDNIVLSHITGPLLEESHYYPFGLTMAGISSNALKGTNYTENRLKYNGKLLEDKELSDGSGLSWYDYGARRYDPQIGRWHVLDALSEKYYGSSPYAYAGNNPALLTDPDGRQWSISVTQDKKGNTMINILFTGVIYNSTGRKYDVIGFQNTIKSQIERVFNARAYNDDGTTISSRINVNLKTVNSVDEISETDHIIELVNADNAVWDGQGKFATGRSPLGGLRVYLNFNNIGQIMAKDGDNNTVPHELGHTLGLIHPEEYRDVRGWNAEEQGLNLNNQDNTYNFMLTFLTQKKQHTWGTAVNVSSTQLRLIESNYRNGYLNQQVNFDDIYSRGTRFFTFPGAPIPIPVFYKTGRKLLYPRE